MRIVECRNLFACFTPWRVNRYCTPACGFFLRGETASAAMSFLHVSTCCSSGKREGEQAVQSCPEKCNVLRWLMQRTALAFAACCADCCSVLRFLFLFGVKTFGGRCASRHTPLLPDYGCCILNAEKGCARERNHPLSFAQPLFL